MQQPTYPAVRAYMNVSHATAFFPSALTRQAYRTDEPTSSSNLIR